MTQALILDAQQRSALAVARSLGSRGVTVHVADTCANTLAGSSHYVQSRLVYPDPRDKADQFTEWVLATARRLNVDIVLPLTDLSTMLLAPVRDRFEGATLACAPLQSYELVSDKAKLIDLAVSAGVAVPGTTIVADLAQLHRHLEHCAFPLVLKPARSKVLVGGQIVATNVCIAHSREQAHAYAASQSWFGIIPCLAQQYIAGHGAGVFAFFAQGRPVAWFAHLRIREKPPSGGVSVLCESAPLDAALRTSAEAILRAANWNGVAMVEFKIGVDGTPYLMEINGRLWGSLQLAIDCGVDFPWLLHQDALARPIADQQPYKVGRRLRWVLGDLDNLLIQVRTGGLSVSSKLSALGRFLGAFLDSSSRQEIFRWGDTAPAFFELKSWLRALT